MVRGRKKGTKFPNGYGSKKKLDNMIVTPGKAPVETEVEEIEIHGNNSCHCSEAHTEVNDTEVTNEQTNS